LPAIPDSESCATVCQNRYVVRDEHGHSHPGDTCVSKPGGRKRGNMEDKVPTILDAKGRHALVCAVGGSTIMRHNFVRDVLGVALRPLVSGVQWERYLPDIERADGGEKSRLDLVVRDPKHAAMLDIVVFHPLQACLRKVYAHRPHESKKFARYVPTKDGRRQSALPLVPVVVSTFGALNETAGAYFADIERTAQSRGKAFVPAVAGPRDLGQLVSLVAILESASIVASAHSQRRFAGVFVGGPS